MIEWLPALNRLAELEIVPIEVWPGLMELGLKLTGCVDVMPSTVRSALKVFKENPALPVFLTRKSTVVRVE